MSKGNIATTLKSLRLERKLTQKQLAKETGLSLSSIISYENGLREPNSKAMAVLERYFLVSGEFLRGELTSSEFSSKTDIIVNNLDEINTLMEKIKYSLNFAPLEKQKYVSELAVVTLNNILDLLNNDKNYSAAPSVLDSFYKICSSLNPEGQNEIIKRASELTYIEKYKSDE